MFPTPFLETEILEKPTEESPQKYQRENLPTRVLPSIKELPFIAIIEGVEDPYNFGASLRALAAAGASGLVLPKRNWMNAAATVIKSSAGASESLPTAETADLGEFLKKAKKRGFEIIAAERKNAEELI